MVSALWKASSLGDLEKVREALKECSSADVEIKDQNGVTPLIEAVRNGHVEVVRVLLDLGADPNNSSSQGRPAQYTSDQTILDLLGFAHSKLAHHNGVLTTEGYPADMMADPSKAYYMPPPPGPYGYYAAGPPPPMPEGAPIYYQQQPGIQVPHPDPHHMSGSPSNLPPPDVARMIPCRFFPACRYGTACLFAHPNQPSYSSPMPPATQYPHVYYDPSQNNYTGPQYYAGPPPPSFQQPPPQPNGVHSHMSPTSPSPHQTPPPMVRMPSSSEMIAGPGVPPQPYPMRPVPFVPGQPMPVMAPPPPPHHMHGPPPPQHHQDPTHTQSMYPRSSSANFVPFVSVGQQPIPVYTSDVNENGQASPVHAENYGPRNGVPHYREGPSHSRRGSHTRRGSLNSARKPPCLFFPAGRCKNGDECRFPHVIETNPSTSHFSGRGGYRGRGGHTNGHVNGHHMNGSNTFGAIEEKMNGLSLGDDGSFSHVNGHGADSNGSTRPHSADENGNSRRSSANGKSHQNGNGAANKKSNHKQRVPNADEFPVLAGSTTPPTRSPGGLNGSLTNGNGHAGPTAAQVLQRPAPVRRESTKGTSTRSGSPEFRPVAKDSKTANGQVSENGHEHSIAPALEATDQVAVAA